MKTIGLIGKLHIDNDGNVLEFKSILDFFHPKRHIPPTNPTNDMNISPVEGYTFAACRSMQNAQVLTATGGCSKYCLKYCIKVDEQNFVIVQAENDSKMVTKAKYLHNTKIVSSKMAEDKDCKKYENKVNGFCIGPLQMLHLQLQYPEAIQNLNYENISTLPLELWAGVTIDSDDIVEDGAYVESETQSFRKSLDLEEYCLHTPNQIKILDDINYPIYQLTKSLNFVSDHQSF